MLDLDTPRFTSSQIARAAGIDTNTFRSNFMRGHFRMIGKTDRAADQHGVPHLFGLRDAIGYGIAAELMRNGVKPRAAWEAGLLTFAHTGDRARDPGARFDPGKEGFTTLLFWPATGHSKVVAMPSNGGLDFATLYVADQFGRQSAVLVVMLDRIYLDVVQALAPEEREA